MLPYGHNYKQFEYDSKKSGDLYGYFPSRCRRSRRNGCKLTNDSMRVVLRRYKKKARREAEREIMERICE